MTNPAAWEQITKGSAALARAVEAEGRAREALADRCPDPADPGREVREAMDAASDAAGAADDATSAAVAVLRLVPVVHQDAEDATRNAFRAAEHARNAAQLVAIRVQLDAARARQKAEEPEGPRVPVGP